MNPAAILASVRALGADLELRDGLPWLLRGEALPPALIDAAREAKPELVALLQAEAANDARDGIDAAEAEAIRARDYAPPAGAWTLEDHRRHKAHLDGLQHAADQRPPSWSGFKSTPSTGAWCSCCRGQYWLTTPDGSRGWCCVRCHPHGAPAGVVMEVSTDPAATNPEARRGVLSA
jgi:hypothetical protein